MNTRSTHGVILLASVMTVLFFGITSFAQTNTLTEKQKLILEFRKATGADKVNFRIGLSLDDVKNDLVGSVDNEVALTAVQKEELRKSATDAFDRIDKQLKAYLNDEEQMTKTSENAIFQVYDQTFNEAELRELIAFYGSPTGKKALHFLPTLSAQVQKVFQTMLLPMIQEFIAPKIKAESDELKKKIQETKTKKP